MGYILHIDTSAEKGLVALAKDGVMIAREETANARDHASSINIMIDKVVKDSGIELKAIDALAVVGGPGSYTGLRIGLATAKAFCYVLDKPLILHNKLMLLAMQDSAGMKEEGFASYAALLPARQQEYFFAQYDIEGEVIKEPTHILAEELQNHLANLSGRVLLTGNRGEGAEDITDHEGVKYLEDERIRPEHWARRAREDFDCHSFVNVASAEPFYLKQVYTHKL